MAKFCPNGALGGFHPQKALNYAGFTMFWRGVRTKCTKCGIHVLGVKVRNFMKMEEFHKISWKLGKNAHFYGPGVTSSVFPKEYQWFWRSRKPEFS